MELPGNIKIDETSVPGSLRVSYRQPSESAGQEAAVLRQPLDLWAMAWILGNGKPISIVDILPPRGLSRAQWRTLVLRVDALGGLFEGIEFRVNGSQAFLRDVAEIREDLRRGLFITYDMGNVGRGATTVKPAPEDKTVAFIAEQGKKFLGGAFPHALRRRFPAHVFKTRIDEKQRVFGKSWIPLLGPDREGRLAAVQVTSGTLTLSHVAAGLDAALYCRAFLPHLRRNWFPDATADRVAVYLVADRFDPVVLQREDEAAKGLVAHLSSGTWLDVCCVRVDPAGLPKELPAGVEFPVPEAPAD
jgi:hypothetical protein